MRSEVRNRVAVSSLLLGLFACSQAPISVPVRSLEQSGRTAFMCLRASADNDPNKSPGIGIDGCQALDPTALDVTLYPNLYALVTQTTRGEVALINLSSQEVVDLDPAGKPGFNFIPTGAQPVDIASTPGGTATFVGSARANYESIWIIPSKTLRPYLPNPDPSIAPTHPLRLTSFAACALPSAPGPMVMLIQPGAADPAHLDCDGKPIETTEHPNGDLSLESSPGTRKLLVTLPDEGGVAVIDAQRMLDREAGSYDACPIERFIPLRVDLPPVLPQQRKPEGGWDPGLKEDGSVCELNPPANISTSSGYVPRPVSIAYDSDSKSVYIGDESAPVVHVLDVSSLCSIQERSPLLPMSAAQPDRVVVTRDVSISPVTSDGKKYLYAVDYREGSVMIFDVSLGSTDRTPLLRNNPSQNPFQSVDRLAFSVPVKSISFALRDNPIADATSGVAPIGEKCDPDVNSTSLGVGYRTSSDYLTGAGPRNLRGVFGFLALTNGQIVVIDVDDFDASCRRPPTTGPNNTQLTCAKDASTKETFANYDQGTGELSCQVVERNQPRNNFFMSRSDVSGGRVPGIQSYPVLSLKTSACPSDQSVEGQFNPRLLPPADGLDVYLGGLPLEGVEADPTKAIHSTVYFDFREPRAHFDQDWSVTYEGQLPGFAGHVGRLQPAQAKEPAMLRDGGGFFCDRGVHDFVAAVEFANGIGLKGSSTEKNSDAYNWALEHTDELEIIEDFLDKDDPYWTAPLGTCDYNLCKDTFGLMDAPISARRTKILEAYQDHVVVADPLDLARCCFPVTPRYSVRPKQQWVVVGTGSGFLHRVVTNPKTGRCVDSCDPAMKLRNGRAIEVSYDPNASPEIPKLPSPKVFQNPVMQFVVWKANSTTPQETASCSTNSADRSFTFRASGGFVPLMVNLAAATSYVQPQALNFVPQLGQLAVTDGSIQGLVLLDLATLRVFKSYY